MKKHVKKAKAKRSMKVKNGSKYACGVCGVTIVVDDVCGCVDTHDILCCGTSMKSKKK